MWEWVQSGGAAIIFFSGVVGAIGGLILSGTKAGKTAINFINKEPMDAHEGLRKEVRSFMSEHKGCKPKTEKRLEALEDRVNKHDDLFEKDLASLRILFRIDDVMLDHCIYDNHIDQCKECKDELHNHILNR